MNLSDAGKVLAKCAAFDNRQTTAETVKAWAESLADMPLVDALSFVTDHYAASREWIMPADLNTAWHQLRKTRQLAVPDAQRPQPPQDLDGSDYLKFRKAVSRAIGHGATVQQAQAAGFTAIGRAVPKPEITTNHDPKQFTTIGRKL